MKCVFCYTERVDDVPKNLLEVYHWCTGCDEQASVTVARQNKGHQWCMLYHRLNGSCYVRSLAHLY